MTREDAISILGLTETEALLPVHVRAAFAREIKLSHPDTFNHEAAFDYGAVIERLRVARDLLLSLAENGGVPCPNCKGTGCIPGRIGVTTCSRCNGERFI